MSAANPQEKNPEGKYHFEMRQPVSVYLVAMAVGDIECKAIDGQTGVYTEPSMLDKCQSELQELPAMMQSAQKLIGPYLWERYDVLVLPLGFPIGGMENPRLTFSTPTIEGTVLTRNKADASGKHPWKAEVTEGDTGVSADTIKNWYSAVYEPVITTTEEG